MKNKKQLTNDQIDRLIFLLENEEKRSKKIINFREGLPAIDRTTFNAAIKKMPNDHIETIIDLVVKMNLYHKTGEPEHAARIGMLKKAGYVADAVKLGKEYHKNKKDINALKTQLGELIKRAYSENEITVDLKESYKKKYLTNRQLDRLQYLLG